ncbi:hypothetical protein Vafri_8264 [Volvox africanus]|nr:hypothetical protein Vafri_8264 [Volvox africanus]
MSGPPGFPFQGFRPNMPGGMGFPGPPPGFGGMPGGMGMRPMMMPPVPMGGMGMGGMPLGMGLPQMRPPMSAAPSMGPRPTLGSSAHAKGVYVPPSIAEKSTTVYVGKIASSVPDAVVRTLLDACGRVKSWKRQVDPDTKQPKGFGFCEFEDAEGVLRAMRLLNGLKLDGQELLLKGNAATQKYTEQYEQQKVAEKAEKKAKALQVKAAGEGAPAPEGGEGAKGDEETAASEAVDEDDDAAADNRVLEIIMSVVSEREESRGPLPPPPPIPSGGVPEAAQAANDFLAQLGSIGAHGKPASSSQQDRDKDTKEREAKERERELRDREREWAREADAERRKEDDRRRELDAKYEAKLREWERYERERAMLRDRERERRAQAEAEWRRAVREDREKYESDDDREMWERRPLSGTRKSAERRKRRLAEEDEDEVDRQREAREAERRAKRAAAMGGEASGHEGTPGPAGSVVYDAHPPPAQQPQGLQQQSFQQQPSEVKAEPKIEAKLEPEVDTNDPIYQAMLAAARAPPATMPLHQTGAIKAEEVQRPPGSQREHGHAGGSEQARHGFHGRSESPPHAADGVGAGSSVGAGLPAGPAAAASQGAGGGSGVVSGSRVILGPGGRARTNAALAAMFGDEEETTQKRQLKPIRYSEEEMLAVAEAQPTVAALPVHTSPAPAAGQTIQQVQSPADSKAALKAMMDSIPTSREGVFSYEIKWSYYNASAMGEKFKGWVSSKVQQLLGVPEPTLVDYVVKLLGQHTTPCMLHAELSPVLDNDTETFVIKLYRMVIYETEKAALGLSQPQ